MLYSGGQSTNHSAPHVTTAAGHPSDTRRPSSAAVPHPHSFPRLKVRPAPSPQTLAIRSSIHHCHHRPEIRRHRGSSSSVSPSSIPRGGSISYPSSTCSPPHPAHSLAVQSTRRSFAAVTASLSRAGRPSPFPAVRVAGEVRRHLLIAVPPRLEALRPYLVTPPSVGAAASRASQRAQVFSRV